MKLLHGDNLPLLSDSQRDYLLILRKSFLEKQYIKYKFQDIEICPLVNDPNIYGVSIHQMVYLKGVVKDLGFLTLFLELNKQGNDLMVNSYTCTVNKIDPCFP
jgi:hypothetical protein